MPQYRLTCYPAPQGKDTPDPVVLRFDDEPAVYPPVATAGSVWRILGKREGRVLATYWYAPAWCHAELRELP